MVLIFNLAAGAVLVLSAGAAFLAHAAGHDPYWLITAFGTMVVLGGALELHPKRSWHPRYFWIIHAVAGRVSGPRMAKIKAAGS